MADSYSYFPGCTLRSQAAGFERSAMKVCSALGVELEELESWQCCGAVFPLASDYTIGFASPYRTLCRAHARGKDLVTLCSGCYNVLKRVNRLVATDAEVRRKLQDFVELGAYAGERKVLHLLEALKRSVALERFKEKVVNPLKGLRVGAYYGCLLLKPPDEMEFDDPEDPSIMEEFLEASGAEPVRFPMRTECCGSYLSVESPEDALGPSSAVVRSAASRGAEMIAVSCPLCLYNLERAMESGAGASIPAVYFTELLALALGATPEEAGIMDHAIDPVPLLRARGLFDRVAAATGGGDAR